MAIQFFSIPLTVRVPGSYVEFDGSRASRGSAIQPHDTLLMGQKLSTGVAVAGTIYPIGSPDEAISLFGQHSQLAQECAAYKAKDKITPCFAVALADEAAGTAATGVLTFTGTATESRELAFYVGGRRVVAAIESGDAAADAVTKLVAAIGAHSDMPITAADGTGDIIDVTARHKGTIGNQILMGFALNAGERVPAGLTAVVTTPMAGGATDPDHDDFVVAMGDDQYHTLVCGIRTDTEIDKLVTELEDRWGPLRQIEGVLFAAAQDTQSNLTTYCNGFNSPVLSIAAYEASALCPLPWEVAAQVAGINARQVQADPAVNGVGSSLANASAAPRGSRFKWAERNTLLTDGASTLVSGSDGRLQVEWLQSTYQTNALGLPDTAFRDLYKVRTLAALRYSFRVWMSKFANAKLADDGNEIPGQLIVTPSVGRSEASAWFLSQRDRGWVENYDQFAEELIVERDASDGNRLNFLLPPDLIDNLAVSAGRMAFR